MAAFTQMMEQLISAYIRGSDPAAAPVSLTFGLYTADPQDDISGAEVSDAGYSRQAIALTEVSSIVGTGTLLTNNGAITFGPATTGFGTVTHWVIWDVSGTRAFYHGAFLAGKTIGAGEGYVVNDATLQILNR